MFTRVEASEKSRHPDSRTRDISAYPKPLRWSHIPSCDTELSGEDLDWSLRPRYKRVMSTLRGRTIFISGASRGIGLAIATACARAGARIAIAAKTTTTHPKLSGTIYTAADEISVAGGEALPLVCDIRDGDAVKSAVAAAVEAFGGSTTLRQSR